MPNVVNLKNRQRRGRRAPLVAIDKTSGAGRFFEAMVREIERDLGGRRALSRIENELIRAFAGCATTMQYLNAQVALGEIAELDLSGMATVASTMLRLGVRLGCGRRSKDVPSLEEYIAGLNSADDEASDAAVSEGVADAG
jgi:hypothetical protein